MIRADSRWTRVTGNRPNVGDRLVRIADWPVNTFVDFTQSLMRLRSAADSDGWGQLGRRLDPTEHHGKRLAVAGLSTTTERDWSKSSLSRRGARETRRKSAICTIQSLPVIEVALLALLVRAADDRFCHRRRRLLEPSL